MGQNLPDLVQCRGYAVLQEVRERLDRRQPGVSRGGLIPTHALQMFQERQHEWGVDVLQV
jgi:hypothetical protein